MLLLVQAARPRAVAIVRDAGVPADVGPTSPSGWTAAWLDEDADLSRVGPAESHVLLVDGQDGPSLTVRPADGDPLVVEQSRSDETVATAAARVLTRLFGPQDDATRAAVVDALLDEDLDLDLLMEELEKWLDLPVLRSPAPDRAVVATRCDAATVRLVAQVNGPLRLVEDQGWTVLAPTSDRGDMVGVAAAVAASARRSEATVLLWRRGTHDGVQLWSGGRAVTWSWNDPWQRVGADGDDAESVAQALRKAGRLDPDTAVPALRRLLHRPGPDPLLRLVDVVGLPEATSALLGEPALPPRPGETVIEPTSWKRAMTDGMIDAWRHPLPLRRSLRLPYAVFTLATVLATVVMAGMTALTVVVLATDGAYVDQAGTGPRDWAYAVLATTLTIVLLLTSAYRIRRLRGHRTRT